MQSEKGVCVCVCVCRIKFTRFVIEYNTLKCKLIPKSSIQTYILKVVTVHVPLFLLYFVEGNLLNDQIEIKDMKRNI